MNPSNHRLIEILFYAFIWEIGFLIPVQLFMRARILFENTTIYDYVILGIVVIGAFVILWMSLRSNLKRRIIIFLVIIGVLFMCGFCGFIISPIRQFPNQILPHITFGMIEIEQMVWLFALIAGCGLLILGTLENIPITSNHSLIQRILEWIIAVIIHFFGYILLPFESGVYFCLAFGSGIILLLSSVILPIHPIKTNHPIPQDRIGIPNSRAQRILQIIILNITALLSTCLILLFLFTYFQILDEERERVIIIALLINLALGLIFWGVLLIIPKVRNIVSLLIPFGTEGMVAGIFVWGRISASFYIQWGQYVFLGIGIGGMWIYNRFVFDIIDASPIQRTLLLVWHYLSWLISSYLSFIPFIATEWIVYANLFYQVFFGLGVVSLLNFVLIFYFWWGKRTRK